MYFYDKSEGSLIQVTENKGSNTWTYQRRRSKLSVMPGELIRTVEPRTYNYWIDRILEGLPVPESVPGKGLQKPEVGKKYILGDKVMKLEYMVPGRLILLSCLTEDQGDYVGINESEAEDLGIEYQEGLIPLHPSMGLREYDPSRVQWDPEDLETYPRTTLEGMPPEIHYIILSLGGFKRTENKEIIETPRGDLISVECFLVTLKITLSLNIVSLGGSSLGYREGDNLEFSYITEEFLNSKKLEEGDFVDANGKIHLVVKVSKGGKGVDPLSLRGLSARDLFKITWDSAFSLTERGGDLDNKIISEVPSYNYQIFRKEKSGFLFRRIGEEQKYISLVEK